MRTVHDLEQGSSAWHAHRNTPGMINGSEIAAMMGLSSYVTRSELLRRKATGIEPEHDAATLARFAMGHINEALARPIAESILDADLSAMVMSDLIDGVLISVSLDGITQGYDKTMEHKSLNMTLADSLDAGVIPDEHHPQMEAGLMVSGATRCLFMASKDGDPETAKHAWYESNPALRPKIVAACKQFSIDLAAYVHVEVIPAAVAAPQMALPAVFIQVNGSIALTDNLAVFGEALTAYVERINKKPETDQDFADLEATVKTLKTAEEALDAAENSALGQAASIDTMRRAVAMYRAIARDNRLMIDKLVKAEKENRKAEIVTDAAGTLAAHVKKLNERIGGNLMPVNIVSHARFVEAIKGLKSLDSMRDKVTTALANAKIEANEIADTIEANIKAIPEMWKFLFADMAQICTKPGEDFARLAESRIAAHKAAAAEKAAAAKQAEDARIAAAVEAERKAGEARAAQLTANNQTQFDQMAKADAGVGVVDTARAQPDAASSPPLQSDEAAIDDFIGLLPMTDTEKRAHRLTVIKWEKYRVALLMRDAARAIRERSNA